MKMFMLLAFLCIGFLLLAKIAGDYAGDVVFVITTVLFLFFFISMAFVGGTILVTYFLSGTVLEKYQAKRSALVYQLENLNYSDQVATELLYEQIISFNEDVLMGKVMVYDPWLQWAVSGDYQYIDLIEYSNKEDSASK
jgi:hypothetical protein